MMDIPAAGRLDREAHQVAECDHAAASLGRLVGLSKLVAYVRSGEPDLTNRQMAVIQTVAWTEGPHTVRGLAAGLGLSKPVITRALNTLGGLDLIRRLRDETDRRNVFVVLTAEGAGFLERIERICARG